MSECSRARSAVGNLADRLEQRGDGRAVADPSEGLRRPRVDSGVEGISQELNECGDGLAVAPQARRMDRGLADGVVRIEEGEGNN